MASSLLIPIMAAGCATHVSLDTPRIEERRTLVSVVQNSAQNKSTDAPVTYPVDLGTTVERPTADLPIVPVATAEDLARLSRWVENHSRLYDVASTLMIKNVEICANNARPILGFTAKNKFSYTTSFIAAAERALHLGEQLQVMEVLPGSGAQSAGLTKGDVLVSFNGKPMPTGVDAEREASVLIIQESRGQPSAQIGVERDGAQMDIKVPLTAACAFGVELGDSEVAGSYADGYRAMVTKGMLQFVQSDTELAYVIANEFARNLLTKAKRPEIAAIIDQQRFLRSDTVSTLPQASPYSRRDDLDADRLALHILAHSGYALDAYEAFWRRLAGAQQTPGDTNSYLSLHPDTEERLPAIPRFVAEIAHKKSRNVPLKP
jgi:hypothetical protein